MIRRYPATLVFHFRCEPVEAGAKAKRRLDAAQARLQYRCGPKAPVPQRDQGGGLSPWLYHHTQPFYSDGDCGKPAGQVTGCVMDIYSIYLSNPLWCLTKLIFLTQG